VVTWVSGAVDGGGIATLTVVGVAPATVVRGVVPTCADSAADEATDDERFDTPLLEECSVRACSDLGDDVAEAACARV
jgi:hypothetical protein